MQRPFTEAARRALQRAAGLARLDDSPLVEPLHLLWAMVVEESRATELLGRHGVTRGTIPVHLPEVVLHDSPDIPFAEHGPEMQSVIREARTRVDRRPADEEITTEHLLWGLTAVPTPASEFLTRHGVDGSTVSMDSPGETHGEPLPVDFEIAWRSEEAGADEKETRLFDPDRNSSILSDATYIPRVSTDKKAGLLENSTLRTLDAAANRAREGLRVVEDFTRFHLNDAFLTRLLKESRHELANAV
ncbi:MAG: Clp protease N-terminal domain-containing protein, partial [Planctomycetaceae bacterium]